MPDRRDPTTQGQRPEGRRVTDPTLTTRDCADRLGVSPDFIVGEILDGRLRAQVLARAGHRRVYRVAPADLDTYLKTYRWTFQKPQSA